jgi:hypothetical protein
VLHVRSPSRAAAAACSSYSALAASREAREAGAPRPGALPQGGMEKEKRTLDEGEHSGRTRAQKRARDAEDEARRVRGAAVAPASARKRRTAAAACRVVGTR